MKYSKRILKKTQKEDRKSENLLESTRGITLIALVITVIVMLILAGVAISILTDDGGLFDKTRGAAETYQNAAEREAKQLNTLMNEVDQYLAGIPVTENPETKLPLTEQEIKERTSGSWNGKVNTPQLATGMTAVYWDEAGEEKELTSSSSKAEWNKWYSYVAQTGTTATTGSGTSKWANAITKDENGNITGYWVWIPRYEYKLAEPSNGENAGTITVNFISIDKTTETEGYKIHSAFINNPEIGGWDSELPGFWVAKYEAGYQKSTVNSSGIVQNASDTVVYSNLKYTNPYSSYTNALGQNLSTSSSAYASQNISYPVFKPLTYAYNCINIDGMFRISRDIKNKTSLYGLTGITDSHLMKNSEWGAVAYLAWSQYGRNGTKPNINNVNLNNKNRNIYAVTGMVAEGVNIASTSGSFTGNAYNTETGQLGSTTGNITGVYDMNGGLFEYVAAYINNTTGATDRNTYAASLVATGLASKYRTIYPHNAKSDTTSNNWVATKDSTIYGDAVTETSSSSSQSGSWNSERAMFPQTGDSFFLRGGDFFAAGGAGLFSFDGQWGEAFNVNGIASVRYGFRVCLVAES